MGTYKTDWTDTTPSATVHAKGHNDVAVGLAALETTVAGLGSGGGSDGGGYVDITVPIAGALIEHRYGHDGTGGNFVGFGFYAPRPFTIEYFHVTMEKGPTGGPLTFFMLAQNSVMFEATIPAGAGFHQVTGALDSDYRDSREINAGWVITGDNGYAYIDVSYDSSAVTDLGRDVVIRLGGTALPVLPDPSSTAT